MNLVEEINKVAKLHGKFVLRSGKTSNTYFDKYKFEANPILLKLIAEEMNRLIPKGTEVLAGLEMGGIPVVTMLSQISGLPAAFIRKEPKTHGTCQYAEGTELNRKKILIIEDVVSSGGAIIDAVQMMRADSIEVDKVLCVIDRETGGKERLKEEGIELLSLLQQSTMEKS